MPQVDMKIWKDPEGRQATHLYSRPRRSL